MLEFILERANYWAIIALMMVGLYITYQSTNLIKKLVGLSVFQTSVFLFYITLAKFAGGTAPILFGKDAKSHGGEIGHGGEGGAASEHFVDVSHGVDPVTGLHEIYSNPLPHVLILTAIVVGVSTLSVGLALIVRIREAYGTIEVDEMRQMDIIVADAQDADDVAGTIA